MLLLLCDVCVVVLLCECVGLCGCVIVDRLYCDCMCVVWLCD